MTSEHEDIPPGEAEAIDEVRRLVIAQLQRQYPPGSGIVRRDAHPKHHGVVRAELIIDSELPEDYRVGVFSQPRSFSAWVRFSNGSGVVQPDIMPDGRGVAIKLMGVEGPKLLADEADGRTQDFLFISHDVFLIKDAKDYVELFKAIEHDGAPTRFFLGWNPFMWRLKEFAIAKQIRQQIAHPFAARYWSMVPFLMGARPAKFSIRPCNPPSASIPEQPTDNFLREAMVRYLARDGIDFDFLVQLQTDPQRMPVEDPRTPWDESLSPFRKVATLRIKPQTFDTPAQQEFAEDLSFTPWHCVAEHRPLGGVNRCRQSVYQAISTFRHQANGKPRQEPTGDEVFN
jgi:hypothetical protein